MNKEQTKDYIRKLVLKYEDKEFLKEEDFNFMLSILSNHERAEDKIGIGVKRIWLQTTNYKNKSFWLERLDGTKTDFSFLKCFKKTSAKEKYLKACRKAIEPIVIDFRDKQFGLNETLMCPILNIPITKNESHVDHDAPFQFIRIAKMFYMNNIGLAFANFENIEYLHEDGTIGLHFKNRYLEKEWIEFHNKHANLRIISAKANQSLKKETW